jgi:tetratricopeptide (TPR) repeat protein
VRRLLSCLLLTAGLLLTTSAVTAQRPKPDFDPETKDGFLIQYIQQEKDPVEKLHYMEQFAAQYPSHPAIAWVYDQLQPAYFQIKEWDQAMHIGALRMAIEADNLEAAKIALRSAEAKHDPEQTVQWADRVWQVTSAMIPKGGPAAADARQTREYAEFCVYSTAMASKDPKTRLDLLEHLEQRMPASKYTQGLTAEYFRIYSQLGDEGKSIDYAERGLKIEPDNVDMLMFLAEVHSRKDIPAERQLVIVYTARLIEAIDRAQPPASMSAEDWEHKKVRMLGTANYMGGVSNSLSHNFARADTMLRAALPFVKDNEAQLAATLYHLAMSNYRLAEASNDRTRPVDALKFMRRCATIRSPFQEQAVRNVESIRSEYNLP